MPLSQKCYVYLYTGIQTERPSGPIINYIWAAQITQLFSCFFVYPLLQYLLYSILWCLVFLQPIALYCFMFGKIVVLPLNNIFILKYGVYFSLLFFFLSVQFSILTACISTNKAVHALQRSFSRWENIQKSLLANASVFSDRKYTG